MSMSAAAVTVAFNGCPAATDGVMLSVPGGWLGLTGDAGLAADVAPVSGLTLTQGGLLLTVEEGASLDGSVQLAVAWTEGDVPALLLENVGGPPVATVTWPTQDEAVRQLLTPGEPMALAGIIVDC